MNKMEINVSLEDLYTCGKCGIVFDKRMVRHGKSGCYRYICPLCKNEIYIED